MTTSVVLKRTMMAWPTKATVSLTRIDWQRVLTTKKVRRNTSLEKERVRVVHKVKATKQNLHWTDQYLTFEADGPPKATFSGSSGNHGTAKNKIVIQHCDCGVLQAQTVQTQNQKDMAQESSGQRRQPLLIHWQKRLWLQIEQWVLQSY